MAPLSPQERGHTALRARPRAQDPTPHWLFGVVGPRASRDASTVATNSKNPVTLYRYGNRSSRASRAKNASVRTYRRELADAVFGPNARTLLLERITAGTPLPDAAALAHVSPAQVHGRARWDTEFRDRLDTALEEWSRPRKSEYCGTPTGYRARGCRCKPCRRAHNKETGLYR